MILSQLLWTCPDPGWDLFCCYIRSPIFSWTAMHSGIDYRTTFQPRYIHMQADFRTDFRRNKRSYYWLPHSCKGRIMFFECISEFGCMNIREQPSGRTESLRDLSVTLFLELRSEILHFMDQTNLVDQATTKILRGPVRIVALIQVDTAWGLWKYPCPEEDRVDIESTYEQGDTSPKGRDAWLWPDRPFPLPEGVQVCILSHNCQVAKGVGPALVPRRHFRKVLSLRQGC